jgi:hypothetical protein
LIQDWEIKEKIVATSFPWMVPLLLLLIFIFYFFVKGRIENNQGKKPRKKKLLSHGHGKLSRYRKH